MINYPGADSYRSAMARAALDTRWTGPERRALATLTLDEDNNGTNWGSGRLFKHGRFTFLAHLASEGINLGRAN